MPMSDHNPQSEQSLSDKIAELEALLAKSKKEQEAVPLLKEVAGAGSDDEADIPILDELVHAEDAGDWPPEQELPSATAEQLMNLINTIEHRLTDELEIMLKTLKSTMKESIIDELKIRLETPANNPVSRPTDRSLPDDDRT